MNSATTRYNDGVDFATTRRMTLLFVIHSFTLWIPAYAGMTVWILRLRAMKGGHS